MKLIYLFLVVLVSVLLIGSLLINKKNIIDLFMVDGDFFSAPDLIVVLEGGNVSFSPTRERADKAIELYKRYPGPVLVCAYREHKAGVIKYLVLNGMDAEDLTKTFYEYDGKEGGGTYNNVLEIISVIKQNNDFQNIVIVTSPYHELRVSLIFSILIEDAEINRLVNIKYFHINNSEVLYTDISRFIRIISHELLGILGLYIQSAQDYR